MATNSRLSTGEEQLRAWTGATTSYALKRPCDILVAGLALIALAPLLGLLALLILLFSGRPALYKARRLGRRGSVFTMYKFRTMVPDAEAQLMWLADRNLSLGMVKIPDDPRVTGIGRWIRRFSLDELPQLWNVLCGHMSIVGPRPHDVAEVRDASIDPVRLSVRPGLTGLWQLWSRDDPSLEARVYWDKLYVARCSLSLDVRLMLQTVPAMLRGGGGSVTALSTTAGPAAEPAAENRERQVAEHRRPLHTPRFPIALRGYERQQVDAFVREQASRLAAERRRAEQAEAAASQMQRQVETMKERSSSSSFEQLGSEAAMVLKQAGNSATLLIDEARMRGEALIGEARAQAGELLKQVEQRAAQIEAASRQTQADAAGERDRVLAEARAEAERLCESAERDARTRQEEAQEEIERSRQQAIISRGEIEAEAARLRDYHDRMRAYLGQINSDLNTLLAGETSAEAGESKSRRS